MSTTENPVNDKADNLPINDKAVNEKEDHLAVNDKAVNEKADHLPVNDKAVNDEADHLPLNDKAVTDKADNLPVNDKADNLPVNDKVDHPPVKDKADNHPANEKADNLPAKDKADHLPEEAKGLDLPVEGKADNPPANDKADHLPDEAKGLDLPEKGKADHLPEDAKDLLQSLASKWDDVLDADALQVIPVKGAMTNKVFEIKWPTEAEKTSRKVIVRIYGEGVDNFFDRDDEIRTFEFLSKNEQGPRLLGRFANGRIEEFIHARTLSASDLRDPSIAPLIAAKMKEFHDLDLPGSKKVHLWDRLRNWHSIAKRLSSPEEVEAFYLDTIDKEIAILEKELSEADQRIGFCHNDLQYGNIMLSEETNSVTLIDYEYATYNPIAYDIANHFCEMAANYHTDTPHTLDFSKCPDLEERKKFVRAYLSSSENEPSDSEVEQLVQEVEKYTLVNHLFWGLWGIISGHVNKIEFDYKEYAKQRIQEYWARKPYLLCSAGPSLDNIVTDGGEGGEGEGGEETPATKPKTAIFRRLKKIFGLGFFRSKN